MALFKCKMCGGALEINNETVATCEYCGTQQTLPKLDDDRKANLYDRANHFRRNNEYDKAMGIYEKILNEDKSDAEAYWSLVLCRYGIEYVEDPTSHKRIPTVNRAQFTSIFDDDNYRSALQYADGDQRRIYEEEARAINEIQKGILAISQQEEPFDVFICYKETDTAGRRTPDSVLANDLYHQLTQEGFKVFFARITLEDKLGSADEPYIFAALNSAKVMIVLGTKPEYFNAVWVKNEWSRYLALIKSGAKKMLIPAYRDMDPYDLPEEFSHLQAQDMSKLGFMQDIIRGIKKILDAQIPKTTVVKETVIAGGNANTASLLKRVFMFLEDGDWRSADEYCEKVLDIEPECAEAYLGKLMVELKVRHREELRDCPATFESRNNYQKAMRFADVTLAEELDGYNTFIEKRNQRAKVAAAYQEAQQTEAVAGRKDEFDHAAERYEQVCEEIERYGITVKDEPAASYHDAAERAALCRKKGLEAEYTYACSLMESASISSVIEAKEVFARVSGWKDANEKVVACEKLIERLAAQREEDKKIVRYNEAERLLAATSIASIECARNIYRDLLGWRDADEKIAICDRRIEEIRAHHKDNCYDDATGYLHSDNIDDVKKAGELFASIKGWRDADAKADECRRRVALLEKAGIEKEKKRKRIKIAISTLVLLAIVVVTLVVAVVIPNNKYKSAIALMDAGKYEDAIAAFEAMGGYKDSDDKIAICTAAITAAITDRKYNDAISLMDSGSYHEAILAFEELGTYKDCVDKISECNNRLIDERLARSKESLEDCKVGEYVLFGAYEQDDDSTNGKEDIEWLVLEVSGGKAFVVSKYILDARSYSNGVTWENSSLRKWLNEEFMNDAFIDEERTRISLVNVPAEESPKSEYVYLNRDTQDKLFLLSISEVDKYLADGWCMPTLYAIDNGVPAKNYGWWLRVPGHDEDHAVVVFGTSGYRNDIGFSTTSVGGVRPAMWIDLNVGN